MEKLKKFFGDSKGLVMNFAINIILVSVLMIILPIIQNKGLIVDHKFLLPLFFVGLYIGLFFSYKKRETHIQEALISAIFVLSIVNQIYEMKNMINALIFFILFILHLFIVSDKNGNETILKLFYIMILFGFIYEIINAIITKELPGLLTSIPAISLLISIDTKLFLYKEMRSKSIKDGTWTFENKKKAKEIFNI